VPELVILEPHGFCDGVKRAIDKLERSLKSNQTETLFESSSEINALIKNGTKIGAKVRSKIEPNTINLAYNQIVHNTKIVDDFQSQGVIFVQSFEEIEEYTKKNAPKNIPVNLFISAHGISPKLLQKLQALKNLNLIDATCPLVYKVHQIADQYLSQNYQIFYLGKKNHEETKGILGHSDSIYLIENSHDIDQIPEEIRNNSLPKVYLCQTTLSVQDTEKLIEQLKEAIFRLEDPPNSTICYATTQRQNAIKDCQNFQRQIKNKTKKEESEKASDKTKDVANKDQGIDLLLVIGSANSSNSQNLLNTAQNFGIPNAYLIDNLGELKNLEQELNLDFTKYRKIGLTSGASTPEILLDEIKEYLKNYLFIN